MTYKLKFKEPFYALNEDGAESWFVKSYETVDNEGGGIDLEEVDAEYEKRFKVKLLTEMKEVTHSNTGFVDKYEYVIGVEFPSEADATLFVLRWS